MTTAIDKKHQNIIPERYKQVISQKGQEVLDANNLIVELKPIDYCPLVRYFPFAGIFEYVQNADEYLAEERNGKIMTVIKADDIGVSDDDTVKNVLVRLGREPSDTHCWKVYAYELAAPNEKGLKKLLTTDILDIPANTEYHFAGFGYKDSKKIEADRFEDWVIEEDQRLMGCLYPISLYRNELLIDTIIRDADDGMYISEHQGGADIIPNDRRLIALAAARAKSYREGSEYPRLKAEQAAGEHILPADSANLLSDDTKAILANEGLRVKISELPRLRDLDRLLCDKFFAVEKCYPRHEWADVTKESDCHGIIRDEDFGETLEDTAQNLMSRMEGNAEGMSYWACYCYDIPNPNENGHTTIYTTDINDLSENGGFLVGIAISYNFYAKPITKNEEEWQTRQRLARNKRLDALNDDEKAAELEEWQASQLSSLKRSMFEVECWVNKKLIEVQFYRIDNGDWLVGYDSKPYRKDSESFNTDLQSCIADYKSRKENEDQNVKDFLQKINAA